MLGSARVVRGIELASNPQGSPVDISDIVCTDDRTLCDVQYDVPAACAGESSECPIVFFLHGSGGTNNNYAKGNTAHDHSYVGVYPQGDRKTGGGVKNAGPPGWQTGPEATAHCDWSDPSCPDLLDEVAFFAEILATLRDRGAAGRVYCQGSSNGAAMCERLAVNADPETLPIAGIIAKASQLLATPPQSGPGESNYNNPAARTAAAGAAGPPLSVLQIHGTADSVIPYEGGDAGVYGDDSAFSLMSVLESTAAWASHNGCAAGPAEASFRAEGSPGIDSVTRMSWQCAEARAPVIVEAYALVGGGHGVSGNLAIASNPATTLSDIIASFIAKCECDHFGRCLDDDDVGGDEDVGGGEPEACADDSEWHGRMSETHSCEFVAAAQTERRCGWTGADGRVASDACRLTCGSCTATSTPTTSTDATDIGTCSEGCSAEFVDGCVNYFIGRAGRTAPEAVQACRGLLDAGRGRLGKQCIAGCTSTYDMELAALV